jgi:uridine phosphorylase
LVCSSHGIGLDGILPYYANWETINENELTQAFIQHCNWPKNFPYPYCVAANEDLYLKFSKNMASGITATAPGFYGPQGRELRLKTTLPQLNDLLATFASNNLRITNFEMETSALYGLGKLLNHRCLTVCVIIANRALKNFTTDYEKSIEILITTCLDTLTEKN